MKETEFRGWLESRYIPSTARTYLSDMRRVAGRTVNIHGMCGTGDIDALLEQIKQAGKLGHNKSSNAEITAVRTYIRFLDDFMCQEAERVVGHHVSRSEPAESAEQDELSRFDGGASPGVADKLTYSNGFWHPAVFPREAFVQQSVEVHFQRLGFDRITGGNADWVGRHPTTGERWHIECKGLTTAVGLDFRTGLGQLLQAMKLDDTNYAIAVPSITSFISQIGKIDQRLTAHVRMQFLLVDAQGNVAVYVNDNGK